MPRAYSLALCLLGTTLAACGGGGGGGGAADSRVSPIHAPNDSAPLVTPTPVATPVAGNDAAPGPDENATTAFEKLFSLDKMHTLHVHIDTEEWNGLLNDYDANPRNEIFRQADFYYGPDLATAEHVGAVGFRLRGNVFSRQRPERGTGLHSTAKHIERVHFRIKFNERFADSESVYGWPSRDIPTLPDNRGRKFMSVDSLNLKYNRNDPTYTREVFSYDLFRRFGVPTLRQAYARLYLKIGAENTRYLGVYLMGEHIDKTWARRMLGKNTFIFKSLYQDHGPADLSRQDRDHSMQSGLVGTEITDPTYRDPGFAAFRPAYDLKTKKGSFEKAESRLNDLIDLLTGNPDAAMLSDAIDIDILLRAQAVNVFLGMWDDYWRNGNNYYLALDPRSDKWMFVPYDYDLAMFDKIFGFGGLADAPFLRWGDERLDGDPVLMEKVLAIDEFRARYVGYVEELINDVASRDQVSGRLHRLSALVAPHTGNYDSRDRTPFDGDLEELEAFVARRIAAARRELGL